MLPIGPCHALLEAASSKTNLSESGLDVLLSIFNTPNTSQHVREQKKGVACPVTFFGEVACHVALCCDPGDGNRDGIARCENRTCIQYTGSPLVPFHVFDFGTCLFGRIC